MLNREINLLEEYGLHVEKTGRGRGGTIAYCREGVFLLKGYAGSEKRAELLYQVLSDWEKQGVLVDNFVKNKEGVILVMDAYQNVFALRKWFSGVESDVMSEREMLDGVESLVELQKVSAEYKLPEQAAFYPPMSIGEQLKKHSRELKNVYNYVGNKKQKNEFEEMFRMVFGKCYESATQAIGLAEEIPWDEEHYQLCHKDYTYHNLILMGEERAIVNFDNMLLDSRVSDFSQYVRKIMEKHDWNVELGMKLINTYIEKCELNPNEKKEIYIRLLYPVRFWKIVNHYSNMRKSWVSLRDKEKLEQLCQQEGQRQQFLVFLHTLMYNKER